MFILFCNSNCLIRSFCEILNEEMLAKWSITNIKLVTLPINQIFLSIELIDFSLELVSVVKNAYWSLFCELLIAKGFYDYFLI